jgi:hypothetical protein
VAKSQALLQIMIKAFIKPARSKLGVSLQLGSVDGMRHQMRFWNQLHVERLAQAHKADPGSHQVLG